MSRDDSGAGQAALRNQPRGVLYVLEDDPSARDLLVELGNDGGWDARAFASIGSLRRALVEYVPDLLIIDDDVGDDRGGELARQLHAARRMRDLPIILLTAAGPSRRAELATWASVVPKPFELTDVERRLATIGRADRNGDSGTAAG
jgi:DNA-binding response OmpR family regulator